jgi:hypothetical protein
MTQAAPPCVIVERIVGVGDVFDDFERPRLGVLDLIVGPVFVMVIVAVGGAFVFGAFHFAGHIRNAQWGWLTFLGWAFAALCFLGGIAVILAALWPILFEHGTRTDLTTGTVTVWRRALFRRTSETYALTAFGDVTVDKRSDGGRGSSVFYVVALRSNDRVVTVARNLFTRHEGAVDLAARIARTAGLQVIDNVPPKGDAQ